MYGMVNNALQDLVTRHLGEGAWLRLAAAAGIEDGLFISLESYPDDVTYTLVGGAAEALKLPVEAFLKEFGRHWISYAMQTAYAPLLRAPRSLSEALESLDDMHQRIQRTLPKLNAPSFRFHPSTNGGTLRYSSSRTGLAPFVIGLLHGLAELHGTEVTIRHTTPRAPDTDFDEFELTFKL